MKKLLPYCIAILLFSCSRDTSTPENSWNKYYPILIGSEKIYECTSIKIDVPANIHDTSIFLMKEKTTALLSDTNNCKVYAINNFRSDSKTGEWMPYSSTSVQQYSHSIVRVENNVPYQILRFPAKKYYSWDLNLYNTFPEQLASYDKILASDTILGCVYDSVLTVIEQDFKNLYSYQYAEEHYAKNIGMIFREVIDVESQPNHAHIDLSLPIENRITKGTISIYKLMGIK